MYFKGNGGITEHPNLRDSSNDYLALGFKLDKYHLLYGECDGTARACVNSTNYQALGNEASTWYAGRLLLSLL